MKLLKKEMSRKDFLKYSVTSLLLLGVGSFGINLKDKKKLKVSDVENGYGSGGYGR